jgi:hypothetical protein
MPADIAQAQRLGIGDQDAQDAMPFGQVADSGSSLVVDAEGDEPLESLAVRVEDSECGIARPSEITGRLQDALQHGFQVEL